MGSSGCGFLIFLAAGWAVLEDGGGSTLFGKGY